MANENWGLPRKGVYSDLDWVSEVFPYRAEFIPPARPTSELGFQTDALPFKCLVVTGPVLPLLWRNEPPE